ncbi:hypothetical protein V2J09_011269 [Rumex salicifolius]
MDLINIHGSNLRPWIILGDFNTVLDKLLERIPIPLLFLTNLEICSPTLTSRPSLHWVQNNQQSYNKHIWCTFDRVLTNSAWDVTFPHTKFHFDTTTLSDHLPILFFVCNRPPRKRPPFRFNNNWVYHENFLPSVAIPFEGHLMFVLTHKVKALKQSLKKFNNIKHKLSLQTQSLNPILINDENSTLDSLKLLLRTLSTTVKINFPKLNG